MPAFSRAQSAAGFVCAVALATLAIAAMPSQPALAQAFCPECTISAFSMASS
jgi:hypothetical protein